MSIKSRLSNVQQRLGFYRESSVRNAIWQASPSYWYVRRFIGRMRFAVVKRGFKFRSARREGRLSVSLGLQILWAIVTPTVIALLSVILLTIAAPFLKHWSFPYTTIRPVPEVSSQLRDSSVSGLYGTAAQIAGIFLGLYFTAVSLLANTYREVPPDLRRVVIEEKAGSVYLRIVAFTGATALFCLGIQAIGFSPGSLNLALVTILTALSVLSFVILGLRVFTFFDPSALSAYLTNSILDSARATTQKEDRWNDTSLQAYHQSTAARAVRSLRALIGVTSTSQIGGTGLAAIAKAALRTLAAYTGVKAQIPPTSRWFERRTRHKSWLTASSTELDMGLRAGALMPSAEANSLWLESHLIETVNQAFYALLDRNEYQEVSNCLEFALTLVDALATRFEIEAVSQLNHALLSLARLSGEYNELAGALDTKEQRRTDQAPTVADRLFQLANFSGFVSVPCAMIAGVGRGVRELTPENVVEAGQQTVLSRPDPALGTALPPKVFATLQFFAKSSSFERDVEKAKITPEWFVSHHVARSYSYDLATLIEQLVSVSESTYGGLRNMATQKPLPYTPDSMVVFIQRGREACEKLRYHGAVIGDSNKRLIELKRTFGEQDWATIDTNAIEARIHALDSGLVAALASVSDHLSAKAPSQQLPDAFGYALATLGNESFNALLAKDDELFASLFPTYLLLALKGYDRVNEELSERDTRTRLLYGSDLLLEVAEISGYAYLVAGSSLSTARETVERAWLDAFSRVGGKRLTQLLLMVEEFRDATLMSLTPRDILRTGWRQRFGKAMVRAGFMNEEFTHSWDDPYSIRVMPLDPMVHAFFRNGIHFGSSRDIFYLAFLANRPEIGSSALPRGAQRLADNAQRVTDSREEARKGFGPFSENPRGPFAYPGTRRPRSPIDPTASAGTPVQTSGDERQAAASTAETDANAPTLNGVQQPQDTQVQEEPTPEQEPDA